MLRLTQKLWMALGLVALATCIAGFLWAVVVAWLRASRRRRPPVFSRGTVEARQPFTLVEEAVETHFVALGVPGAVLLRTAGGKVLCDARFGGFKPTRVGPVASATKWMSSAVVMSLVADGRISLDDPISKYLPVFDSDKAAISIRQLLACTSGLPSRVPWLKSPHMSLATCVDQIAQVELIAPPGSRFIYGGVGFQIAGRIAEIAGGRPWRELFRDRIQRPLALRQTEYGIHYPKRERVRAFAGRSNPHIGGGMHASLTDYAIFLETLLNEGRGILPPALVREIETPQIGEALPMFSPHWEPDSSYGLGVWIESDSRGVPAARISCPGASGFLPWIDRDRRYFGILTAECDTRQIAPLYKVVANIIERLSTDAIRE